MRGGAASQSPSLPSKTNGYYQALFGIDVPTGPTPPIRLVDEPTPSTGPEKLWCSPKGSLTVGTAFLGRPRFPRLYRSTGDEQLRENGNFVVLELVRAEMRRDSVIRTFATAGAGKHAKAPAKSKPQPTGVPKRRYHVTPLETGSVSWGPPGQSRLG